MVRLKIINHSPIQDKQGSLWEDHNRKEGEFMSEEETKVEEEVVEEATEEESGEEVADESTEEATEEVAE